MLVHSTYTTRIRELIKLSIVTSKPLAVARLTDGFVTIVNPAKLSGVPLDGTEPTFENIASGKYKGGRKMFIYVKKDHVGVIPGLDKFVAEYVSEKAAGEEGYLSQKGLVALPKAEADKVRSSTAKLETMTIEAFTN